MERLSILRVAALLATTVLVTSSVAHAESKSEKARSKIQRAPKAQTSGPLPWCAEELETLPNGLCYINGGQKEGKRTLVIFLHGAIAQNVDWQWLQARALSRYAKQNKFEAVFARAPLSSSGYVWPGTANAQEQTEGDLIDGWNTARSFLEKRNEKQYDEVYLMGFSSGAYFVSSLAMRGRVKGIDGYAVFAGGGGGFFPNDVPNKAPVFVGVCMDDKQTAGHSRSFGGALSAKGWPHRVDEQHVGHMFADIHFAHALTYLRSAKR